MPSKAQSAVAPLYLFACLLLGGSAQGIWQNAVLQLAGLGIIAWAASAKGFSVPRPARFLLLIVAAGIGVVALQEIPLPPATWDYGVRARILDGYRLLGQPVPAMAISLSPYESLGTLLCVIPPVATFCAIVCAGTHRRSWLAAALLAGTILGVMLGALQVVSSGSSSAWYPYAETNLGVGVGFFANANHMATLLLISLPFIAALAAAGRGANLQRYSALVAVLAGAALVVIVGIALNGSLAGYALVAPVAAASMLVILPRGSRLRRWLAVAVAISVVVAIVALATSSIGATRLGQGASVSVQSRQEILATTAKAIGDFMPFGSGLGSFIKVYPLYEHAGVVTDVYVVHAHNDYAELALELGVAGIALMLAFLGWWGNAVAMLWRHEQGSPFARAASIASAAVLVHSLVDFPLRTAAISACFAMCLALLADRKPPQRQDSTDLRPTRHLVIS